MNPRFDREKFWAELDGRIAKFDLLTHPFYQAWSAGQLTRDDLRDYAADYYPHVAAFPTYLSALHCRLPDGELRRAVLRNLAEEEIHGRAHSELWLDFAEGMGGERDAVRQREPMREIQELVSTFRDLAQHAGTAECLAAFYAYESQVPRIAAAKASGLEQHYAADARTVGYFHLHRTADVRHSRVWRRLLEAELQENPGLAPDVLAAGERACAALWRALDGIDRQRHACSGSGEHFTATMEPRVGRRP
ncbi:MAG: CADD family putative folate metabolism protein [Terriglobales bacterium]